MIETIVTLYRFVTYNACIMTLLLILQVPSYAQGGPYSTVAQRILDSENSFVADGTNAIDVFKFSVNDIINSLGETVENANGDPTIFGRTDYGSEFSLTNDLSTSFNIEIPAFVIDDLAENDNGEYFPVIKNGNDDDEDGTYVNTYTDDVLGTQVTEYFNSKAPDKIETIYNNGPTEIEYLSDSGIDAKDHIYEDGSVYKTFFVDDETDILASTYTGTDGFTSRHFVDPNSGYSYTTNNNVDGSTYTSFYDGSNESYSQTVDEDNEIISSYYYDDSISLNEFTNDDGTSQTIFSTFENDGSGNFKTIVENRNQAESITNLQYTDQNNTTPIEFTLDSITDTGVVVTQTFKSDTTALNIVKTNTEGNIKIVYGGEDIFEYSPSNKDNLVSLAPNVIANGENVIADGLATITDANSTTNPNILSIDFKELYDTENGLAIAPEMGFVRLKDSDENEYINLSSGDIVEFFVRPTDTFLEKHNSEDLFFINRPIPEEPVVTEVENNGSEYNTSDVSATAEEKSIIVAPGEEAIVLPNGEVKVYVTTIYVQAPASKFLPTQVVMPVTSEGDYNYEVMPAPAETFPDEVEVVAIPEKEAEELSKKVKAIKKEKASPSKRKEDDTPPVLDPEIEAILQLNIFLNDVQKGPSKLLSETKRKIQKEFPNISTKLINLIINSANSDEKFDLIRDPKEFLDKEFAKLSDPTEINLLLGTDLSQNHLTKIYNLILYKFSSDLSDLGFETLKNQKIDFSSNIKNADQILEQVKLQQDILAIASLFGSDNNSEVLSNLIIKPVNTNSNSSTALFESGNSQRVLDQMKQFSNVINVINSSFNKINAAETVSDNDIPVVEINVQLGESIADALQKKLNEDKRLNRNFQTRSQSSKLDKFDFEIPVQDESSTPPELLPLLAETPNITDQELQLVAETTEATNNILNETIKRMLDELGDTSAEESFTQPVLAFTDENRISQENEGIREEIVFSNALSSAQRLREVEDIRAVFQILGIGS